MKKRSKRILNLLLLLIWTQTVPSAAALQENTLPKTGGQLHTPGVFIQEVYVDYKPVESMETAYINQQHHVMIPLSSVIQALGKVVTYDPESGQVTIHGAQDLPKVALHLETGMTTLDGTPHQGEGSLVIHNQRTYIPLHWLVDFYGYQVYCEEVTRSVYINPDYPMEPENYRGFRRIENLPKPTFIAHAGGMAAGLTHTNSLEAIQDSLARGICFVELDFLFTTDNQVVLGHNWGLLSHLMELPGFPVPHETFMDGILADGLTQLDLEHLTKFMTEEEQFFVVTDTKEGNLSLLTLIAQEYPHLKHRFIPQVYDEEEYEAASALGYKHLIYSLYQVSCADNQVLDFAARHNPYAVTMATERVENGLAERLKAAGIHTYTHTINTEEEWAHYQKKGVYGVYTATLPFVFSYEPTITSHTPEKAKEE